MARFTLQIAFVLMLMNFGGTAMMSSGVCEDWGGCGHPGGGDVVEDVNQSSTELASAQEGNAGTLYMLFNTVTSEIIPALTMIVAGGPIMFHNLGLPGWATTMIFGPAYLLIMADTVHLLSGRDTM